MTEEQPGKKKRRLRHQLRPEEPKPAKLNGKIVVCEKIQTVSIPDYSRATLIFLDSKLSKLT